MRNVIIDGKKIAEEILTSLAQVQEGNVSSVRLGVVMSAGDAATESFIRIKSRAAQRLNVEVVREELPHDATTEDALLALARVVVSTQGVIVQLPLPTSVDVDVVLAHMSPSHDVDAIGPEPRLVLAPVAGAVKEILDREKIEVKNKKAVVVGAGKLVGKPSAELLRHLGADVSVVTTEQGSLDELAHADIVVLGAGNPGFIKPTMLKQGVVVIDAGTSEAGGKLVGDADPACANVASVFTPVPGGMGPIAVAMIFKNLFTLVQKRDFAEQK